MMTSDEKSNLANFLRVYVEQRLDSLIGNAIDQLNFYKIKDTDKIDLNLAIHLTGVQLKTILDGELAPQTAIKLMTTQRGVDPADFIVHLDKE